MHKFEKVKVNVISLSARRAVCGVGINDAWYKTTVLICGKKVRCKIYQTWKDMIRRGHDQKYQAENPTYIGCTVVKEWHRFSVFAEWMQAQNHDGLYLDKDIILPGNKVYGPDTCFCDR